MTTHSSILAWRAPRTEEPGGLQSMGSQRVGHNLVTKQENHKDTAHLLGKPSWHTVTPSGLSSPWWSFHCNLPQTEVVSVHSALVRTGVGLLQHDPPKPWGAPGHLVRTQQTFVKSMGSRPCAEGLCRQTRFLNSLPHPACPSPVHPPYNSQGVLYKSNLMHCFKFLNVSPLCLG